jgi:hypothetical protein
MTDLEALVVAAYVFADDYPVPSTMRSASACGGCGAGRFGSRAGGDRDQL